MHQLFLLSFNWSKCRDVSVFVLVPIVVVLYWSADYTGGGGHDAWPVRSANQSGKRFYWFLRALLWFETSYSNLEQSIIHSCLLIYFFFKLLICPFSLIEVFWSHVQRLLLLAVGKHRPDLMAFMHFTCSFPDKLNPILFILSTDCFGNGPVCLFKFKTFLDFQEILNLNVKSVQAPPH